MLNLENEMLYWRYLERVGPCVYYSPGHRVEATYLLQLLTEMQAEQEWQDTWQRSVT